ncbi:hypothetical protein HHL24_21200 [Paraburkholderia sp. RP-4-7]|uniref:Uncharacterized protein n=1 Tax=Paraburkholderia polaris TaxID=2728848 RepID=A0A848IH25_9BURK|nr:hypothetical protein [Paraburkholderia polaris]NMM00443.1 hypothetical protein [Paraburkholderia polaris]
MLEQQKNKTLTPVDLRLSNGDTIAQTLHGLLVCDGELIPPLFDPTYALPESAAAAEGSVHA